MLLVFCCSVSLKLQELTHSWQLNTISPSSKPLDLPTALPLPSPTPPEQDPHHELSQRELHPHQALRSSWTDLFLEFCLPLGHGKLVLLCLFGHL